MTRRGTPSANVAPPAAEDPHAVLRNPFDPKIGTFRDNIRLVLGDLSELRESMKAHGWVKEFPALIDENGVVLVGNRRLAIAKELGITPVTRTITLGFGDAADAERFRLAIVSNVGAVGLSGEERKRLALYLYRDQKWSQQSIATAFGLTQQAVSKTLRELQPGCNSKKGRPRGGGTKAKAKETGAPSAPKTHRQPTDADHMAAIVKVFASGEPFTARKAATMLGNLAPTYALTLLQRMQGEPTDSYVARPYGAARGTNEDAEWHLVLADIDLKTLMQEPEATAAAAAPVGGPDEAAPEPPVSEAEAEAVSKLPLSEDTSEPPVSEAEAASEPPVEMPTHTPFVIPPGAGPRIKYELRRVLKNDDLARRFVGVFAEIARGNNGATFEAMITCGTYLMNELGAQGNTVEEVLAAYDELEQPMNWTPETEKEDA